MGMRHPSGTTIKGTVLFRVPMPHTPRALQGSEEPSLRTSSQYCGVQRRLGGAIRQDIVAISIQGFSEHKLVCNLNAENKVANRIRSNL
eukprot:3540428-Amphidinium_carterae.1